MFHKVSTVFHDVLLVVHDVSNVLQVFHDVLLCLTMFSESFFSTAPHRHSGQSIAPQQNLASTSASE